MGKTQHFKARMSQRGINGLMVSQVLKDGIAKNDHRYLGRKECRLEIAAHRAEIAAHQAEIRALMKLVDKGGVVVVEEGGALITAYKMEGRHV